MIIVVNRNENVVVNVFPDLDELSELSNGYPLIVKKGIAFPKELYSVYSNINNVPDRAEMRYCYTESEGFYINPNYIEPDQTNIYGIPDDVYHAIIDDYTAELFGGEE